MRLVSEEVKIGQEFNSQNWSQKGKKLASETSLQKFRKWVCETSLRGVKNGLRRLVSEELENGQVFNFQT